MKLFNSLFTVLKKENKNLQALRSLDSLLKNDLLFDSATSVLVIHRLCEINQLVRAKKVLSQLTRNPKISGFFLYSIVIHCIVKDGRIKDVECTFEEIIGNGSLANINVSTFMNYLCKLGKAREAKNVCQRVLMENVILEYQSYLALIGGLCQKNEAFLAGEVLRAMEQNGFQPDYITHLLMFQCFCRLGLVYEADIILRSMIMKNYTLDICVYGSFIHGLCKSGKLREADKLFKKLINKETTLRVPNVKPGRRAIFQLNVSGAIPEIMAYEAYCRSLCNVGQLEEAGVVLKALMSKRNVPETCVYGSFIRGLCRAGRVSEAMEFFNTMRKKGWVSNVEITLCVIKALCEIAKTNEALGLFDELSKGGFVPTTSVINDFLTGYWRERQLNDAMRLFERIMDGSCGKPDASTYSIMVTGLCENGHLSKALCIFQEMINNKVPVNGSLYDIIIRGLCKIGSFQEAHMLLNEMIENGYLASYLGWSSLVDSMLELDGEGLSEGYITPVHSHQQERGVL
ncbi:putative pentatricopeptide repeat-containing protein At1g12700, mitochondrial [Amborella trichopoda]|nr:putative pentatricopeptide repeat-containing protein At1g12700, mitochondrial [Amborella trichopoda]|eukprot:XP_006852897.2 putative pentatricopeptide repeat-containing protein At1g12700, mitochondrial [Amborella trichopoda]